MKKRLIGVLIMLLLSMELAGCGGKIVPTNYEDIETASEKDYKKPSHMESTVEPTAETESKPGGKHPNDSGDGVVFGSDFDKDYDGFDYLYYEELMTDSDDGESKGKKVSIFIPNGDYSSINKDTAYADSLGVDFQINLNPYIRFDENDYLVSENLKYYLDDYYDVFYCTDYYDIQFSEISNESDGARAYVSYCYYDKWNDQYIPQFVTYYLKELDNSTSVLIEVKVDMEEITGKTPQLLEELESFYGFDIEWNEERAKNMLDQFLASNDSDVKTFSTGYLLIELPSDWERDYDNEEDSIYIFAPDGKAASGGCMILINREYLGTDSFDIMDICSSDEKMKEYAKYLKELWGDSVENIEVTNYGDTCMGKAVKVTYDTKNEGNEYLTESYVITDEDYMYKIEVIALPDCETDAFAIAESILKNGIVNK